MFQLHRVSRLLRNERGLLFTSEPLDRVVEYFEQHSEKDFLRTGGVAEETVVLQEGPLSHFSHAIEPQLRQLGMPTALKKGVVHLTQEYTVCKAGQKLTSEQARILKLFDHQQAKFKINLIAYWNKEDSTFKMLNNSFLNEEGDGKNESGDDDEEEEDEAEMSE